jgi:hypothetical protein
MTTVATPTRRQEIELRMLVDAIAASFITFLFGQRELVTTLIQVSQLSGDTPGDGRHTPSSPHRDRPHLLLRRKTKRFGEAFYPA